ncbi:MAG: chorismate mutase [Bacillus sp. (in: firmicutes)]|jgi:chorismate mutase|uniref:chorismate mutase n=1 Tax=Bacillus sp. 1NLA3E TaxID=666686 RepID=UPI000247E30B|nr:chorismate mutase [Bacillus sp. 1NLA3E]AGK54703.1 chorismate mutase [Bacillus sp. 1NLA3E]MDF2902594.1 chorismate mutase [Bacillus sp. (in: firmicutes)]
MIRGVRGAITVKEDNDGEIVSATERLLRQMIQENQISSNDVASIFISVTEDVSATFPAKAVRLIEGWTYVPVMCMTEIPVPSGLKKCIRVMMHVNTSRVQEEIIHTYLDGAEVLRPDLHTSKN